MVTNRPGPKIMNVKGAIDVATFLVIVSLR